MRRHAKDLNEQIGKSLNFNIYIQFILAMLFVREQNIHDLNTKANQILRN